MPGIEVDVVLDLADEPWVWSSSNSRLMSISDGLTKEATEGAAMGAVVDVDMGPNGKSFPISRKTPAIPGSDSDDDS